MDGANHKLPGISSYPFQIPEENYPNRPVRFIVPFASGSSAETAARFIRARFTQITGKQVIIER